MDIKIIIAAIIFLLIGFGTGIMLGIGDKTCQQQLGKMQEEMEWYKSLLADFYPPIPEEIHGVSGKVTKIGDKTLWIDASIRVSRFPLPGGKETEKKNIKVNVADDTEIVKIEMIEPPPLPPEDIMKETVLSFEDIKAGDSISIGSEEDIKGKTEITATKINLTVY